MKPRILAVHKSAHPFARFVTDRMNEARLPLREVERKVGLGQNVTKNWRAGRTPRLDLLEAALNYFGYQLVIVPKDRVQ